MSPGLLGGTLTSTGVLGQRPGPRGATERHRPSDHPTLAAPTRDSATPTRLLLRSGGRAGSAPRSSPLPHASHAKHNAQQGTFPYNYTPRLPVSLSLSLSESSRLRRPPSDPRSLSPRCARLECTRCTPSRSQTPAQQQSPRWSPVVFRGRSARCDGGRRVPVRVDSRLCGSVG